MVDTVKYDINFKNITVKTLDGSEVTGKTNIQAFPRLSDMMKNSNDKFVIISSEKQEGSKRVTIINKEYIVWAEAED